MTVALVSVSAAAGDAKNRAQQSAIDAYFKVNTPLSDPLIRARGREGEMKRLSTIAIKFA